MRKIRGFRLALHPKEMRRRLRRLANLQACGVEDEAAFERHIASVSKSLQPAVVFDSLGPESKETARISPIPGLAHTIGFATLGPGADGLLALERSAGPERGKLAERILQMALDECVRFVIGLIAEEVEAERCDLSPIHYVSDPGQLALLSEKLGASKIGLALEDGGGLKPRSSSAFCLNWIVRPRGRRSKTEAGKAKK
ncbi:MAG: hypothetical protein HY922_13945 [Elusimicrobia bacterium]|nr:hypothetical protein [Elusimicrobiota bacterium]